MLFTLKMAATVHYKLGINFAYSMKSKYHGKV